MGMNQVTLTGNLVNDPEVKTLANGTVCNFRLANDRFYKSKDGQHRETVFVDCEAFGATAELLSKLSKGSKLLIHGSLRMDTWEREGQKRSKIKIGVREFYSLTHKNGESHNDD
jgi:single-strand DNA-binding protein